MADQLYAACPSHSEDIFLATVRASCGPDLAGTHLQVGRPLHRGVLSCALGEGKGGGGPYVVVMFWWQLLRQAVPVLPGLHGLHAPDLHAPAAQNM